MRSIRLLPIVVFASLALLAFKTIGLVTNGSYALTGTVEASAAGGGGGHAAAPDNAEPGKTITIPPEPTLEDKAPTLTDGAPTLKLAPEAAAGGHGATPAAPASGGHDAPEAPAASENAQAGMPDLTAEMAAPEVPAAQAEPLVVGIEPGADTERTILNRLTQRRTELDTVETELATRQQLVEAAEKKLAERTAALQAIEARINGLVDQQQAVDEAQFKSLVSMYENMKPADAARIFDALEVDVLVRVAKAINPRKMAPIMAKMNPAIAQVLTVKLAATSPVTQPTTMASADFSGDLPQIVGQ